MRAKWLVLAGVAVLAGGLIGLMSTRTAAGMPDYAGRTGEPCATCHVNPAGGGRLNPRGQAWVAAGRPDKVPQLAEPTPSPVSTPVTPSKTETPVSTTPAETPTPEVPPIPGCGSGPY